MTQESEGIKLKNGQYVIRCDDTQMRISRAEYVICQHQAGLGSAHLGFTALLYGKIDLLIFAKSDKDSSVAFERMNGKIYIYPNGRRDYACEIDKWELEAVDGLIMDCMLGRYTEEVNIDIELFNVYGKVNFTFMISDFFL